MRGVVLEIGMGLCSECVWRREIVSDKGSYFLMCLKCNEDPSFPKYPRLPVLVCSGYQTALPAMAEHDSSA